jgi:hypothetical protein
VLKWSDEPPEQRVSVRRRRTPTEVERLVAGFGEQRYGADRVLPQPGSIVEHIGPPSEEAAKQCR